MDDHDPLLRHPQDAPEVGLGGPRHGDDAVGRLDRQAGHEPHVEAVLPGHGLREQERHQVVNRHHGAVAPLDERQEHRGTVVDIGAQPGQAPGEVAEKPQVPGQMVLEGDPRAPRGDVRLTDREAGPVPGDDARVAVDAVDPGQPGDQAPGVVADPDCRWARYRASRTTCTATPRYRASGPPAPVTGRPSPGGAVSAARRTARQGSGGQGRRRKTPSP